MGRSRNNKLESLKRHKRILRRPAHYRSPLSHWSDCRERLSGRQLVGYDDDEAHLLDTPEFDRSLHRALNYREMKEDLLV